MSEQPSQTGFAVGRRGPGVVEDARDSYLWVGNSTFRSSPLLLRLRLGPLTVS